MDEEEAFFWFSVCGSDLEFKHVYSLAFCPQRIAKMLDIKSWVNEPYDLPLHLKASSQSNVPVKFGKYSVSLWSTDNRRDSTTAAANSVGISLFSHEPREMLAQISLSANFVGKEYVFSMSKEDTEKFIAERK